MPWGCFMITSISLRGSQDVPEEDSIPHTDDLQLIRCEGYSVHRL